MPRNPRQQCCSIPNCNAWVLRPAPSQPITYGGTVHRDGGRVTPFASQECLPAVVEHPTGRAVKEAAEGDTGQG